MSEPLYYDESTNPSNGWNPPEPDSTDYSLMGPTIEEAVMQPAIDAMRNAGERNGTAAGTWVADGNTDERALKEMRRQWADGDPAAPEPPAPFSGEWADCPDLRERLEDETELDPDSLDPDELDALASAYEDAYYMAWAASAERTVNGLLGETADE